MEMIKMMATGSGRFIPESDFRDRIKKIRCKMAIMDLDALITYAREKKTERTGNTQYISGFNNDARSSMVVLPREEEPVLVVKSGDLVCASAASWMSNIVPGSRMGEIADIIKVLDELHLKDKRLGIVGFDDMPATLYTNFKEALKTADVVNTTHILRELRMVKSPNEIKLLKECCEIQEKGFEAFFEKAKEGVTEHVPGGAMIGAVTEAGAEAQHIHISTGFPPDISSARTPTWRKLKKGDVIAIIQAMSYKGYFTQIARTGVVGKPRDLVVEHFDAVVGLVDALHNAIMPGVTSEEAALAGYEYLKELGLQEYAGSRYGHGTGLDYPGNKPNIQWKGPDTKIILREGFTHCIHPSIRHYIDHPGPGGVLYGDYHAVTKTGVNVLSGNVIGFKEIVQV